jgi:hypothetical protein
MNSVRCPYCHDLYVPENGTIPTHFLDTFDGQPRCEGSELAVKDEWMQ